MVHACKHLHYIKKLMGYQCEIIDYRCPAIEERENLEPPHISLFNPKTVYRRVFFWPTLKKKSNNLEDFLAHNAKIGQKYTPDTISLANEHFWWVVILFGEEI